MEVLIAYASRNHGTAEIAEELARVLEERGLAAAARPVDRVASLEPYGAVVLGSAVYEEGWLPEAYAFLAAYAGELEGRPLWLFSSGTLGEDARVGLPGGRTLPAVLDRLGRRLEPAGTALFGGRLRPDMLSLADRLRQPALVRALGDYRDWERIRSWADGIADALVGATLEA